MKIKSINVKNYRCLKDVAFPIGDLSVLLGANGSGTPFINFIITAGLRVDEAIDSYNLIVQLSREGKLNEYYNTERQILEHYR